MSFKEFLVFIDGSEDGVARFRLAMDVAKTNDAHLDAIVLNRLPGPPLGVGADGMGLYKEETQKSREQAVVALEALAKVSAGAGQDVHVHVVECGADQAQAAAARLARTADLVMLGKPEELDDSDLDTDIFLGAVLEGGRPCLVFPRWINPHRWGRRALVWWKGTPESSRAVHGALPFLAQAEEVRICVANPRGEREGEDERSLQRLGTYLMRHGAKVGDPVMRESWEGPEYMVASEVEGFNADLVVLGAYENGRMREELFGGVTAKLVKDATVPILLAH